MADARAVRPYRAGKQVGMRGGWGRGGGNK